jgi:hypothetical protein
VTLPRPNVVNNNCVNVVKEAKKKGIDHIVKLSVIGADMDAGLQLEDYIDKKKKSFRNLRYRIPFYAQMDLCKTS